jgi:hypothetical protein
MDFLFFCSAKTYSIVQQGAERNIGRNPQRFWFHQVTLCSSVSVRHRVRHNLL